MRLLKMLLLLPFTFLFAVWHSFIMFLLVFVMVWKMLRSIRKERYL